MVSQQAAPLSLSPRRRLSRLARQCRSRHSRTNIASPRSAPTRHSFSRASSTRASHRSILYRPLLRRFASFAFTPLPTPSPFSAVPFPFCLVCLAKESQRRRSWRTAATMKTTARRTTRRLKACRYQLACPGVATGRDPRPERLVSYSKRFSISSPASSCPQPRSVVWAGRSPPREPPRRRPACPVISRLGGRCTPGHLRYCPTSSKRF